MSNVAPNFAPTEGRCKGDNCCGHSYPWHDDLRETVQSFRDYLVEVGVDDPRMDCTSGFRCIRYNAIVGGAEFSLHTKGLAGDFTFRIPYETAIHWLMHWLEQEVYVGGLGIYPDRKFVHIDVRPDGPARWGQRYKRKPNGDFVLDKKGRRVKEYIGFNEAVAMVLGGQHNG